MKITKISLLLLLLSSCGTFIPHRKHIVSDKVAVDHSSVKREPAPRVIIREVIRIKREVSSIKHSSFDFKDQLDLEYKEKHFKFWKKYFSKKEKKRFLRHANNGAKYRNVITKIFKSHGLPEDLFFVGLIESGYNTYVRSHASAVGPWQFIKGTATRYGLRVDSYTDERSHIVKSTEAAANYFKDLYNIFGSWELALCAYNAGEYRIINAIRRGNTRDYKELVALKLIPKETIYYIPKVAAARELYKHPRKYNLKIPKPHKGIFEKVKSVKLRKSFDLYKIAKKYNVPLRAFKALNPDFRKRWIRVSRRKQQIFLPSAGVTDYTKLISESHNVRSYAKSSKYKTYKVRRGDNLSSISIRLGIKISDLKRLNKIRGSKIMTGQRLKIRRNNKSIKKSIAKKNHKVKNGENLTLIARKYKMSLTRLKKLNNLRTTRLRVGQILKVSTFSSSTYKVRKGDNLSTIASKFGISMSKIKNKNRMRSSRIYYGQILKIPNKG